MALSAGRRLGPYEILEPVGSGGMGEVYRAKDTRLDRIVAIKVLSAHLSARPDLRERFEREARAVSALKHANICVLHDVGHDQGDDFLVLEFLEGESLAARLDKGSLPLDLVLRYAIEIAGALDSAHRQGIVHRDLKPGNVMITPEGAKLLDFGLAKLKKGVTAPESTVRAESVPTLAGNSRVTEALTGTGAILGTLQYMAPEQLEGHEPDARVDIFAFGVMLYEMVTGRRAFEGKSQVGVMAAILEHHPPSMIAIRNETPDALDHLVTRCLSKDPQDRWQTARDVFQELKWIRDSGTKTAAFAVQPRPRQKREMLAWAMAAVLAFVAIGFAVAFFSPKPQPAMVRFQVEPPAGTVYPSLGGGVRSGLSRDGTQLVFVGTTVGLDSLWIRPLESVEARKLPNTDGANLGFWSPDARFVGFFSGGQLKKIEVEGGAAQTICAASGSGPSLGGAWSEQGNIIFSSNATGGVQVVSAEGGSPLQVTTIDSSRGENAHLYPRFLPDGRHFFYVSLGPNPESRAIYVGSLDSKETRRITNADSMADFASGYLLFVRSETLFAQQFDSDKLELQGQPLRVADKIRLNPSTGHAAFGASYTGVLYFGTGVNNVLDTELAVFDRTGKKLTSAARADYRGVSLSPDGKRAAVHIHDQSEEGGDVWIVDFERSGTPSRFTFDPSQENCAPVWSPDGKWIAFASLRKGQWGIYRKASDNTGSEELLYESPNPTAPTGWTPDSQSLVFLTNSAKTGQDLWLLRLTGDRQAVPFLATERSENSGQVSADGRWITYSSNGAPPSVWVESFPIHGAKWQVAEIAGRSRWRGDGKELFYLTRGRELASVTVESSGAALRFGTPNSFFRTVLSPANDRIPFYSYDVSTDGQRFLIPSASAPDSGAETKLNVVLNWTAALQR